MTAEVQRAVLPLPVRVIGRWLKDLRPVQPGLLVVAIGVGDPHEHGMRICGRGSGIRPAGREDHRAVAEHELNAMVADTKTLFESERTAEPLARLSDVVVRQHRNDDGPGYGAVGDHNDIVTGGSHERATTYAQKIKNKASSARKSPPRPAAKASAAAAPKPASPAAAPVMPPALTPPAASGELQRLRDELQRINQELSKIGRVTRPDAARQTHMPEKQELLRQKVVLESRIRTLPKS